MLDNLSGREIHRKLVKIICPECGKEVDAVAYDTESAGKFIVSGRCFVTGKYTRIEVNNASMGHKP